MARKGTIADYQDKLRAAADDLRFMRQERTKMKDAIRTLQAELLAASDEIEQLNAEMRDVKVSAFDMIHELHGGR